MLLLIFGIQKDTLDWLNDLPSTGGKVSEDRMMEAVNKLKENIFHHFMGKVEIYEEYYLSENRSHLLELEPLER